MDAPLSKTVTVKCGKEEYSFRFDTLSITGKNDQDMVEAAAKLTFWLAFAARARKRADIADRDYRSWKARAGEKLLESDPKTPDWKREMKLTATEDFRLYKRAFAEALEAASTADAIANGYRMKVDLLRTLRADRRKELDASTELDPVLSDEDGKGEGKKRGRLNRRADDGG